MFKAFLFVAAAIVIAALSAPNLEPLLLSATASLADKATTSQSVPLVQPTAISETLNGADKAETLPAAEKAETVADNVAASNTAQDAVLKPVDQIPTDPQSDLLFSQYQAWLAAQAAQNDPASVEQNAPTQFAEKPRATPLVKKRRDIARTSPTPTRNPRTPVQPAQTARAQVPASLGAEPQWSLRR